jgi:hypothetical protein
MYQKMRHHFSVLTPRAQKTLISVSFHNSLQFFYTNKQKIKQIKIKYAIKTCV